MNLQLPHPGHAGGRSLTGTVGLFLLKVAFPLFYAIIFSFLTYNLFATLLPPDDGHLLFERFSRKQVFAYLLPPLLMGVELLSTATAVAFWRARGRAAVLPLAMFLALQAFPAAGFVVEVRHRALQDLRTQETARVEAIYQAESRHYEQRVEAHRAREAAYQQGLATYQFQVQTLDGQIVENQAAVARLDAQVATQQRLLSSPLIAQRTSAAQLLPGLRADRDRQLAVKDDLERKQAALLAEAPKAPDPVGDPPGRPQEAPLPANPIPYVLATLDAPETRFTLFLVGLFPLAIFAAARLIAQAGAAPAGGGGAGYPLGAAPAAFSLESHLRLLGSVKPEWQHLSVGRLKEALHHYKQMRWNADQLLMYDVAATHEACSAIELLQWLGAQHRLVKQSTGLAAGPRDELLAEIEKEESRPPAPGILDAWAPASSPAPAPGASPGRPPSSGANGATPEPAVVLNASRTQPPVDPPRA